MTDSISRGLDFYIENIRAIFGDFLTIFAYEIFNIDVETIKIVTKIQTMSRIAKKNHRYENFGQN